MVKSNLRNSGIFTMVRSNLRKFRILPWLEATEENSGLLPHVVRSN
jgi:hypothetical protein